MSRVMRNRFTPHAKDRLDAGDARVAAALFDESSGSILFAGARRAQLMSAFSYYSRRTTPSRSRPRSGSSIHPGNKDAPYATT